MHSPRALYRALLQQAAVIDEKNLFSATLTLENLVKTRGKYMFEEPLEKDAVCDKSLQSRMNKAQLFLDSLKVICDERDPPRLLISSYSAMLSGKGDFVYRKSLEDGVVLYMSLLQSPDFRDKLDNSHLAEKQNRIMQKALCPYTRRLALIHAGHTEHSDASIKTTVLEIPERVVVDIDEESGKQVIYIHCESSVEEQEIEDAPVAELEKLPGTFVHQGFYSRSQRVCEAILAETDLHRSRKTFVVGHKVGGSLATLVSCMLLGEHFEVTNTLLFGPCRAIETIKNRYVSRLNCIRASVSDDPSLHIPSSSERHQSFIHVGEALILHPKKPEFSMQNYDAYMHDETLPITYTEKPEESEDDGGLPQIARSRLKKSEKMPG